MVAPKPLCHKGGRHMVLHSLWLLSEGKNSVVKTPLHENVRVPIPFCSKLDQLHWPFLLWNMSRCLIWSVPDLLCPQSTTLPCISSASTHPCGGGHSARRAQLWALSLMHPKLLCRILSPPGTGCHYQGSQRKCFLPSAVTCVLCEEGSPPAFLSQHRPELHCHLHIYFSVTSHVHIWFFPLKHFQWDCLLSSSFLPNTFVLDYISHGELQFSLRFNLILISSSCHISSCSTLCYYFLLLSGLWNSSLLSNMFLISYST